MTYRSDTDDEAIARHRKNCELCQNKRYTELLDHWADYIGAIRGHLRGCDERTSTDFVISHVMSAILCDLMDLTDLHNKLVKSMSRMETVLTEAQTMNLHALERALDSTQH